MSDFVEVINNKDYREEKINFAQVTFLDVQEHYHVGSDFMCNYSLSKAMKAASNDWIGLFKVGWSNAKEYVTYIWAGTPNENLECCVKFPANCVNTEDGEFYQFCYITNNGCMRGASVPFQFQIETSIEELVTSEEDSGLLVVKKRTTILEEQLAKLMKDKDLLLEQLTEMKVKYFGSEQKCVELETLIDEMKDNYNDDKFLLEKNYTDAKNELNEVKHQMELSFLLVEEKENCLKLAESTISELTNKLQILENKVKVSSEKEAENFQKQSNQESTNIYLENELTNLKANLKSELILKNELINNCKHKDIEIKDLTKYIEKVEHNLEKANELLKIQAASELNLKSNNNELIEKLSNLEDCQLALVKTKQLLKDELSTYKDSNCELDSLVKILKSENMMLKESLQEVESCYEREKIQAHELLKTANNERENIVVELHNLKCENERLKTECENQNDKICEQEKIINLHAEISETNIGPQIALQKALDEIRPRFKNLKGENIDLRQKINEMKSTQTILQIQNTNLEKEVEDFNRRFSMAGDEYRNKFKECAKLQRTNSKLEKKVSMLSDNSMSNSGLDYCKKCELNEKKLQEVLLAKEQQDCHLERIKQQANESEKTIEELNNSVHDQKLKLISSEFLHKDEINSLKKVNDLLTEKLSSLENLFGNKKSILDATILENEDKKNVPKKCDNDEDRYEDALDEPQNMCPICNNFFSTFDELEKHVSCHDLQRACPLCGQVLDLATQNEYEAHVNSHFTK